MCTTPHRHLVLDAMGSRVRPRLPIFTNNSSTLWREYEWIVSVRGLRHDAL
jgi:hypothetical protein